MKRMVFPVLGWTLCLVAAVCAETAQKPADNAALRYWMAFAQMNNSQISPSDLLRMDAMINRGLPWDEEKFGSFVAQNRAAIETMIRGTSLPYCEWGVESNLGPEAPIEYVPKARTMARLNSLYGMRLEATGHEDGAVRAAIAGIRFAQHLSENASFIGTLIAQSALIPHLKFATQLSRHGHLSAENESVLRHAVRALPEGAFDWSAAARVEGVTLHSVFANLAHANNPKSTYEKWFGDVTSNFHVPTQKELAALDHAWTDYANLLGLPPQEAQDQLPTLQKEIANLDPVLRVGMPDPAHMVAARAELIKAQHATAEALGIQ